MDHKEVLIELLMEKTQENKAQKETLPSENIGKVCVMRCDRSGVFYGKLAAKIGREGRIENCRRLWYWDGASSVDEIAEKGVSRPQNCKFPASVPSKELTDIIEVIPMSEKAIKSLDAVKIWTQHE
jgi:hypothetical protein